MKLFLASSADKTVHLLKELLQDSSHKEVLLIANAADPYTDQFLVDLDRNKFEELGYKPNSLDLRKTTPEELQQLLEVNDILHICGGSVYYLMALIREKGFEEIITNAIKNETIIYTGTSAGAIIPSKNIRPFSNDAEEKEYIAKVPDHKGLGILNFAIVPHGDSVDFAEGNKKMIEEMQNDPTALFYIQDHQAVWVEDDAFKLLEAN
ncbi:MAG TPA: hypothetical protein ENI66_01100 [Candidatus Yonathbacteria bacterium]|nr:hypothetical protein [Candidatus Yonathbacteria bacterium]